MFGCVVSIWQRVFARRGFPALVCLLTLCMTIGVMAEAAYTGGLCYDSFDGLPASGEFTLPAGKGPLDLSAIPVQASGVEGWSIYARVGGQLLFRVGDGASGSSGVWSYGLEGSADRALGSLGAGSHAANLAFIVQNQTGETLTRFVVSVRGEQWRRGNGAANTLSFDYKTDVSDITTSVGVPVTALDVTSPNVAGSSGSLDGNAAINRVLCQAEVTGLNWLPGQTLMLRWRDVNDGGDDDGLALDDFVFCAPRAVEAAPLVAVRSPAANATLVRADRPVEVVFDQPVTATVSSFTLSGSISGVIPFSLSGGPVRFVLTPAAPFADGETVTVGVVASEVTGVTAGMAADDGWSFEAVPAPGTVLPIHVVQGAGGVTPVHGSEVTVEGIVTADFQGAFPALGGFFVQEEDADVDGDPATSEGIFVYDADAGLGVDVLPGDLVRVTGTATEFQGMTQLASVSVIQVLGSGHPLPGQAAPMLPFSAADEAERWEGMRVQWSQALVVTDNGESPFFQDRFQRYGELLLSAGAPLLAPTLFLDPNDDPASGTSFSGASNVAVILAAGVTNARNQIILDDASAEHYPDPSPYLNAAGTRRCGDTVTGLTGILAQSVGGYRVHPTAAVVFVDSNPRPATPPVVGGRLKVAAMNVLNYFTTLGDRGAEDATEFERQRDKVVAALVAMDADVVGLMEIENSPAALADLLDALNAVVGAGTYAAVPDPPEGTGVDAIRVALFYKPSAVSLWGMAVTDTDPIWNLPRPLRPPLAQVFEEVSTGERFIACVNHFKSKSSTDASGSDLDQADGQGAFNHTRRQQSARLAHWLASVQAEEGDADVLIIGDLNANGEEDPIDLLRAEGFVDESDRFAPGDYSYRFGGLRGRLDHALSTPTFSSQVTGAAHWHINADEPAVLDYHTNAKSAAQQALNAATPFRSSDHDPVLVGVSLSPQPTTFAMWVASQSWPLGADTSMEGDPDLDGLKNLAEFVLNLNPTVADGGLGPFAGNGSGEFVLEYRLRPTATGVQVIPKWSENFSDWFPMSGNTDLGGIDARTRRMRAWHPREGRDRMFGRLEIYPQP